MFFLASGCQPVELPRSGHTKCASQIVRDLHRLDAVEKRPRPVPLRGRDLGQSRRLHPPLFHEARDADLVRARPSAPRLPGREEETGALVVERLAQAIDPAVAERVRDGVLVREPSLASGGFVGDEPNASRLVMVVTQPATPLGDGLGVNSRVVGRRGRPRQAVRASSRDLTCASGSVTWKVVPASGLRSAQSRPWWRDTISRLM